MIAGVIETEVAFVVLQLRVVNSPAAMVVGDTLKLILGVWFCGGGSGEALPDPHPREARIKILAEKRTRIRISTERELECTGRAPGMNCPGDWIQSLTIELCHNYNRNLDCLTIKLARKLFLQRSARVHNSRCS